MQYIQLQAQVAAALDTPIEGSFNLFVDTEDNTIKVKDSNGNLTGGGMSLTEITKTELDSLITSGSLVPGGFYKITNAATSSASNLIQEGGTTLILQATTTSSIADSGVGLFWNPRYQDGFSEVPNTYWVWDNTFQLVADSYFNGYHFDMRETILCDAPVNVELWPNKFDNQFIVKTAENSVSASFFSNLENYPIPFESANTGLTGSFTSITYSSSYSAGDKVIWGGRVWENLDSNVGYSENEYELNSGSWAKVPFNSTDYDLVADIIEYDYIVDSIAYRKDAVRNIEVYSNDGWLDGTDSTIRRFPWGHKRISNISLENCSTQDLQNIYNTNRLEQIYIKTSGRLEADYWGRNNRVEEIIGDTDSDIELGVLGRYIDIRQIRMSTNSTIDTTDIAGNDGDAALCNITMDSNAYIGDCDIYEYSHIQDIRMAESSDIQNNTLYASSQIRDIDLGINSALSYLTLGIEAYVSDCNLENDAYISNINLDNGAGIDNIKLESFAYMEYHNLGQSCQINNITFGMNSNITCYNLYSDNGVNAASFTDIVFGNDVNSTLVNLYPTNQIYNINVGNNGGFGSINITGSNSELSNFIVEQNAGLGNMTISNGALVQNFKIGQSWSLSQNFSASVDGVTIERGFNNLNATQAIAGLTGSFGSLGYANRASMGQLNPEKSFHYLDTTGWDATTDALHFYLPAGEYDGQIVRFVMNNEGTNINNTNIGNLLIWLDALSPSYNFSSNYTELPWYPFSTGYPNYEIRKDIPQCIWLGGKWVIDNDAWD